MVTNTPDDWLSISLPESNSWAPSPIHPTICQAGASLGQKYRFGISVLWYAFDAADKGHSDLSQDWQPARCAGHTKLESPSDISGLRWTMHFKSPSTLSFSKRRQHHPRGSLYANCGRSLKIAFGCCRREVASDQDADIRIKKLTPSAHKVTSVHRSEVTNSNHCLSKSRRIKHSFLVRA